MSQLIHIRQRIKAIETIKKITHAMRLISMSSHSRLSRQQKTLHSYQNGISELLSSLKPYMRKWDNPILNPTKPATDRPLLILIGSHKGLCGTFNSALFNYTIEYIEKNHYQNATFFCIGNKAIDFVTTHYPDNEYKVFSDCSIRTFLAIAYTITQEIIKPNGQFSSVIVLSNGIKNFFVQKPQSTIIIPFTTPDGKNSIETEEFSWEHNPMQIVNHIATMYIESQLHYLFFESLLAEHAARFISMDNSTRNAETILEGARLTYNKLRQAKITKELTELSGSF